MNTTLEKGAVAEIAEAIEHLGMVWADPKRADFPEELQEIRSIIKHLDELFLKVIRRVDPQLAYEIDHPPQFVVIPPREEIERRVVSLFTGDLPARPGSVRRPRRRGPTRTRPS